MESCQTSSIIESCYPGATVQPMPPEFADVSNPLAAPLTLEMAKTLLRTFTCVEPVPPDDCPDRALTRQALHRVCDQSDYQILGICADTADEAIAALHAYLKALSRPERPQPEPIPAAVYLKFNPKTGLCYLQPYTGQHRGVLVSCQSAYDGDVNETFGHLPLDLFSDR